MLSFCFSQKEHIRQKFVADLRKEFAGKGLTFSIGMVHAPAGFVPMLLEHVGLLKCFELWWVGWLLPRKQVPLWVLGHW